MEQPNQVDLQQQYHSQPIPGETSVGRNAYEQLRSKYQRDLDDFRKRGDSNQRHGRVASDEAMLRSMTDGGSILSGSIADQTDQPSAVQHRKKTSKSVRFQVYDAKNMQALQKMRTTMEEKLQNFRERSGTPTGRAVQVSNIGSDPQSLQGSLQGSLSFKPGQLTGAVNQSQNIGAGKTPRPLKLGQPLTSDESEQNNLSVSISQRNGKRLFDEPFVAGGKSIGENSAILSDRVLSKISKDELNDLVVDQLEDRETQLKQQQAVYKLYDAMHNHRIVGQSRQVVDSFDQLKRRSSEVGELTERSEQKRAGITSRAVLHALRDYRRMKVEKRRKLAKAERHDRKRVMIHQKLIMSRMRAVLKFEAMWIKEVRYQFAYSLREEVFKALQLNVRAEKAERLVKMNRYREVLQTLLNIVKKSHQRQEEANEYFQETVKERVIKCLEENKQQRQTKKAKVAKAEQMCRRQLQSQAFQRLSGYYQTRRTIRSDKLLWQAATTNEEFFKVGVTVGSGMQPLDSMRQEGRVSNDREIYTVEKVRVRKHDLIEIKLE